MDSSSYSDYSFNELMNNSIYANLNDKTQRFKKIDQPKPQDLINLILSIDRKNVSSNIVNNIYNVALSFPLLILNKDRSYSLESSFIASSNDIKIEKFDTKKVINFFKKSNSKPLIQLIKGCKVIDLKREISALCFLIVLFCIQDRTKIFKRFKKFFRGIIQETDFQKNYLVDQKYLNKLRKDIRNHELRKGFASMVAETIYKYDSNDFKKKCEPKRQRKLINFIRKFFYLNSICSALEQIKLKECGNELFHCSLKILDGVDMVLEKNNYNDILEKRNSNSNGQYQRRKIAYLFERLFTDENLNRYKLIENIKTISFFIGLLNLTPDSFKEKIKLNQINDKFYALGILLKRFLILIQMKRQIEVAKKNNKQITIDWLNKFLTILADSSVSHYPGVLSQGLRRMKFDESFLKNQYRNDLYSTIERMEILQNASKNVKEMSNYLDSFLKEQTTILTINKIEYIKNFADDEFVYSIADNNYDYGLLFNDEIRFECLDSGVNVFNSSTTKFNYSNDEIATDLSIQNKAKNNLSTKRILSTKNEKINDQSIKKEKINNKSIKNEKINDQSIKNEKINDRSIKAEKRSKKHKLDNSHDERPFKRIKSNYDENSENKLKTKKQKSKEIKIIDEIILDDDENKQVNQQDQNNNLSSKIENNKDLNNNQNEDNVDSNSEHNDSGDDFWVKID